MKITINGVDLALNNSKQYMVSFTETSNEKKPSYMMVYEFDSEEDKNNSDASRVLIYKNGELEKIETREDEVE